MGRDSMSPPYPRIRAHAESGQLVLREGLSLTFFMHRPHAEVAPAVLCSLEAYLRGVGAQALGWYADEDGCWQRLDDAGWAHVRDKLLHRRRTQAHLADALRSEDRYRFEYYGMATDTLCMARDPGAVCAVSFWLPTEYLETHGPDRVRALAREVAAPLPFCSGQAGLSFNTETDLPGVMRVIRRSCFRYPGLDIPDLGRLALKLGTRVRGPAWMTFLGQPVLGKLEGVEGLRARLRSPGTTVETLDSERAVVTLGPWPEAGDLDQDERLPAYRELARVLTPWLYHEETHHPDLPPEDRRRWERRFLD